MTALIIVESMFGNTRTIADSVAAGLRTYMPVEVRDVSEAPTEIPADVNLLLVGAPTHRYGMSRPRTRRIAAGQGATASIDKGVREWLKEVTGVPRGLLATTFDTRNAVPWVPGSAAKAVARRLSRLGCHIIVRPESFHVEVIPDGPLTPRDPERAEDWGKMIGRGLERRGLLSKPA